MSYSASQSISSGKIIIVLDFTIHCTHQQHQLDSYNPSHSCQPLTQSRPVPTTHYGCGCGGGGVAICYLYTKIISRLKK